MSTVRQMSFNSGPFKFLTPIDVKPMKRFLFAVGMAGVLLTFTACDEKAGTGNAGAQKGPPAPPPGPPGSGVKAGPGQIAPKGAE